MKIRSRYLATFADGLRVGRQYLVIRKGWAKGLGLGIVWRSDRGNGELEVTVGLWALSVMPAGYYVGPMDELED